MATSLTEATSTPKSRSSARCRSCPERRQHRGDFAVPVAGEAFERDETREPPQGLPIRRFPVRAVDWKRTGSISRSFLNYELLIVPASQEVHAKYTLCLS